MKKLLFIMVVAVAMASCNNGTDTAAKVDSAAKAALDTVKAITDTTVNKMDSAANKMVDTAKAKVGALVDSAKAAIKK